MATSLGVRSLVAAPVAYASRPALSHPHFSALRIVADGDVGELYKFLSHNDIALGNLHMAVAIYSPKNLWEEVGQVNDRAAGLSRPSVPGRGSQAQRRFACRRDHGIRALPSVLALGPSFSVQAHDFVGGKIAIGFSNTSKTAQMAPRTVPW